MTDKLITYEGLVEECKRLRARHERAEAEFFAFLMIAEREHVAIWRESGCATFDQFLRSNHLCEVDRYHLFAVGVDRAGLDAALANGAHWTIELGRRREPTAEGLAEFKKRAAAFVEVTHVAPAEETVKTWAAELFAPNRPASEHRAVRNVNELYRLREENKILKAKLAAAEKRIAELEGAKKKGGKKAA